MNLVPVLSFYIAPFYTINAKNRFEICIRTPYKLIIYDLELFSDEVYLSIITLEYTLEWEHVSASIAHCILSKPVKKKSRIIDPSIYYDGACSIKKYRNTVPPTVQCAGYLYNRIPEKSRLGHRSPREKFPGPFSETGSSSFGHSQRGQSPRFFMQER